MKKLCTLIIVFGICLVLPSCYTYRKVISEKHTTHEQKMDMIMAKLEPGDKIDIKTRGRKITYLEFVEINDPVLTLIQTLENGKNQRTSITVDQIEELSLFDEYEEVGLPVTAMHILFFLIAI